MVEVKVSPSAICPSLAGPISTKHDIEEDTVILRNEAFHSLTVCLPYVVVDGIRYVPKYQQSALSKGGDFYLASEAHAIVRQKVQSVLCLHL